MIGDTVQDCSSASAAGLLRMDMTVTLRSIVSLVFILTCHAGIVAALWKASTIKDSFAPQPALVDVMMPPNPVHPQIAKMFSQYAFRKPHAPEIVAPHWEISAEPATTNKRQPQDIGAAAPDHSLQSARPESPVGAIQSDRTAVSVAATTWRSLLLSRFEQFKRYPQIAQLRRQQGVVYLRFIMNREGAVLSAAIDKSSGCAVLDMESLALVRRAEPLPGPPPEVTGEEIQVVIPVRFSLDRVRAAG